MVEDDKLIQEYRRRNADYEVAPAAGSWEKLEGALFPPAQRRLYPYLLLAAAVALLLLLSVSVYYMSEGQQEELPVLVEKLPVTGVPETGETPVAVNGLVSLPAVRQVTRLPDMDMRVEESDRLWTDLLVSRPVCMANGQSKALVHDLKPIRRYPVSSYREVFLGGQPELKVANSIRKRTDAGWSLGFFGGNMMNSSTSGSEGLGMFNFVKAETNVSAGVALGVSNVDNTNGSLEDFRNDLLSNASHFATKGDYQAFEEVALQNYMVPTQTRIRHKFPVSAGLSVRKGLSERFYVESGLTYTSLSSDLIAGEGAYYKQEQQLHYLGIPLKLGFTIWKHQRFSLYASAGGMMEFCVKSLLSTDYYVDNVRTHRSDTDLDLHKIQYSASASVGAQFELIKALSFYAEPGISYYFDDKSKFETIRKEHPLNMMLLLGLRVSF